MQQMGASTSIQLEPASYSACKRRKKMQPCLRSLARAVQTLSRVVCINSGPRSSCQGLHGAEPHTLSDAEGGCWEAPLLPRLVDTVAMPVGLALVTLRMFC